MAHACLRVDRFIDSLATNSSGMSVLVVCHGNIMKCLRVRLERQTQKNFNDLEEASKKDPSLKVENCQIMWYSRRSPYGDGYISERIRWTTTIDPMKNPKLSDLQWREIYRPSFSNAQLLAFAETVPQLINNSDAESLALTPLPPRPLSRTSNAYRSPFRSPAPHSSSSASSSASTEEPPDP